MQTRFYAGGPSSELSTVLRGNEDRTDFVCGGGRARAETTRKWQAIKEKAGRKIACPVFSSVSSLGQNRRNRQPPIGGWARSHFLDAIGRDETPAPSIQKHGRQIDQQQNSSETSARLRGLFCRHWLLVDGPFIFWTPPFRNPDARFNTVGKSGKDDNYEVNLPTCFCFPEDIF
jgi:hypothetical protein